MNSTRNAYGNYDDFERDHIEFLKDQARRAREMEEEEHPEFRRRVMPKRRVVAHPVDHQDGRPYVRPHIVRSDGQYPMDYDMSPHPVFRRVLDPAMMRAFRPKADDHDTEKDLVGSIDKNEDWATSLENEEKSIKKEDQRVETVKKVEKVEKKEEKPTEEKKEEKPAEEKPADAKKEDKPKKGE